MREYFSGYIPGPIKGDGELILMAYIIIDRMEDWKETYYRLQKMKGSCNFPDPDIKRLYKEFQKRYSE